MFVFFRRTLIPALAAGILAGWLAVALLLILDVGGLGTLVLKSGYAVLSVFMLLFGFTITFGSAAMGAVIIAIGSDDSGPRSGRRQRVPEEALALLPVRHGGARRT